MKTLGAVLAFSVLAATGASAQELLTGPYQCVQNCQGPGLANITQNGYELNLVNEVGAPSRAWISRHAGRWCASGSRPMGFSTGWSGRSLERS